ncbi:MAG: hypothetical protein LBT43_05055 [Prevotella sp.]|jgi:hypothetical protein|nr:hypothetical protein [Prevotella sp.]
MNYQDIVSTTAYREYTINIHREEYAESPRTFYENLGVIYTAHRNYQPEKDFYEHFGHDEVFDKEFGIFTKSFLKEYIALSVYLYDHSGLSVNTTGFSCRWDTSRFGIIAVPVEKVLKDFNWKRITASRRMKIEAYLKEEIGIYNSYLHNEVYGYTITSENTGGEIGCCSGYYGDQEIEYIIKECKADIDAHIRYENKHKIKGLIDSISKYGKQLLIPFSEFPDMISEPLP